MDSTLTQLTKRFNWGLTIGDCDNFAYGNAADLNYLIGNLEKAGGSCRLSGGGCSCVGCQNNPGLYLHADGDDAVTHS